MATEREKMIAGELYDALSVAPDGCRSPPVAGEYGRPVEIGSDVWVGAGSVVTRDLPSDVFAAGNPCRIVRSL
jgi:acetyltransferase-like isoleucine patch superfamily enzyme